MTTSSVPSAEKRQAYAAKVKAQLEKINAQIDEYEAKAQQAKADAAVSYHSTVEELMAQRDAVQNKLAELQTAGEAAWQDLQNGFESAWGELTKSLEQAASKFQ